MISKNELVNIFGDKICFPKDGLAYVGNTTDLAFNVLYILHAKRKIESFNYDPNLLCDFGDFRINNKLGAYIVKYRSL